MFVQNQTPVYQSFQLSDAPRKLSPKGAPGDTITVSAEQAKSDIIQVLLTRGVVAEVGKDEAMASIKAENDKNEADAEKRKMEVVNANANPKNQTHVVQCSAVKGDGNVCGANVYVSGEDYVDGEIYFCGRHKHENKDDYKKVDGHWEKKTAEELAQESAEEAAKATSSEDGVNTQTQDDVAADGDTATTEDTEKSEENVEPEQFA